MKKRIVLSLLMVVVAVAFYTSQAGATVTVVPTDLPNCERFDTNDLRIIQQRVDQGHQPWRSDPVYYAKFFMNFYYPNLDPNDRENLPGRLEFEGAQVIVKVPYDGKDHTIFLRKAFPARDESIWAVERMVVTANYLSRQA